MMLTSVTSTYFSSEKRSPTRHLNAATAGENSRIPMRVARIPIGFVEGKFGPEKASSNFLIPKFAEIFK